jgi:hypothetical protein
MQPSGKLYDKRRGSMTDADRYLQIAAKYLPPGVIVGPIEDTGDGHRGMAHEEEYDDEGHELPSRIEAPVPDTLLHLWILLHEYAHQRLFHYSRPGTNEYSRNEAEAHLGVTGVMEPKTALRCSVFWTALTPRV